MRAVIVGNGLAGTMAAKSLREIDPSVEIEVFAEERYPYYPRPNLIEFIAGNLPYEKLFAFPKDWEERQNITIRTGEPVVRIDIGAGKVVTRDGRASDFDRLLLANGSSAFVPPIEGADKKGVFVLRTLDDALAILEYLKDHPRVAVLGGGLLGLEIARALKTRGASVTVNEFFSRLLPRQLDVRGAGILKTQIEKMGIEVRLGVSTEEITGAGEATGLKFKDGGEAGADMVVAAAGVKANLAIAKEAGIAVDRGIMVNDLLETNRPGIFAAGDVAQHRERVYGIIPASFDQARTAAFNMLSPEKRYGGTVPSNQLKVAGVFLMSVGDVNPEGEGFDVQVREAAEAGIYKKIIIRNGTLTGAVWMGTRKGAAEITRLAVSGKNIDKWKASLLEDDFDFASL
jgi:nitrite reductase (NADH) large subunit